MEQKNELKRPKNELRNEVKTAAVPEENAGKKPKTSQKKEPSVKGDNSNSEKAKQIIGAFLLLLSVFLFIAFVSYLYNWFTSSTDDTFTNLLTAITDNDAEAHNLGGRLGAALSLLLIKKGFGIGSFFIVAWIFFAGVRASLKHTIVPIWQSLGIFILAMVWVSVTIGFFFNHSSLSILGGISGYKSAIWLEGLLGKMGTGIALLFVLISLLALVYNFTLHGLRDKIRELKPANQGKGDADKASRLPGDEKSDRFNTVEYAVKENETDIPAPGNNPMNTRKTGLDDTTDTTAKTKETDDNGFEPVPMPAVKVAPRTDVEFLVENAEPVSEANKSHAATEEKSTTHLSMDTAFDPTLDLAGYQMPSPDLLDNYTDGGISKEIYVE